MTEKNDIPSFIKHCIEESVPQEQDSYSVHTCNCKYIISYS